MTTGEIIAIVASGLITVVTGILTFVLKGYITDLKKYRSEREIKENAKNALILGMARAMLMENFEKCQKKGYYSTGDKEVYGNLFKAYKDSGGNGIIDDLGVKLRAMPTRPPEKS